MAAAAVAVVVVRQILARPDIPLRFAAAAAIVAAAHAGAFAFLFRRRGARAAALFLAFSVLALMAAGGWRRAAAILVLAGAAACAAQAGAAIGRVLFPGERLARGVRLGFGILGVSWVVSLLLFAGVFRPGIAVAIFVLPGIGGVAAARKWIRSAPRRTLSWTAPTAAAAELLFLLGVVALVRSLAPESGFDALTRYLPWVKIAARTGSFPWIPWQFPFILPQAGLAWAAAFAFDPVAQRAAMLLPLAACAVIVAARGRFAEEERTDESQDSSALEQPAVGIAALTALALLSCPLVLSAAHGLQPDSFGWLAVLLLAVVAASAPNASRRRFWVACGALAALAWCAKYSTAGFVAALLVCAFWRAVKERGIARASVAAFVSGGAGAVAGGAPWLIQAFRESRNPFFPLLSSLFPSPLWRMRIDEAWRGTFAFEHGWRGLLLWPIDMTIHTSRFGEGRPGSFGLVLLLFLFLVVVSLRSSRRTWLAAAVAGTLLIWTKTPVIRYWLPGLWLAAPSATRGAAAVARRIGTRAFAAGLVAVVALQTALAAFPSKPALEGLPWRVFTGRMSEERYIARAPGAAALMRLAEIDRGWPKVWYTGLYAVGHADVIPLMAERWELAFHVAVRNPSALFRYVDSVGCRYWAVANALPDRAEFERLGIPERYWRPSNVVVRDDTTTVYRIP